MHQTLFCVDEVIKFQSFVRMFSLPTTHIFSKFQRIFLKWLRPWPVMSCSRASTACTSPSSRQLDLLPTLLKWRAAPYCHRQMARSPNFQRNQRNLPWAVSTTNNQWKDTENVNQPGMLSRKVLQLSMIRSKTKTLHSPTIRAIMVKWTWIPMKAMFGCANECDFSVPTIVSHSTCLLYLAIGNYWKWIGRSCCLRFI